ncbi:hypothetical protein AC578_7211 [Pseudocercospora eumusae]|uniref:Methyltransferase domain-containing protein n=1 Tax=Pseudocercospora eumusae TaxID=321146 RepID=A0A139HWI2_9PEZI|nr:hypothetical protein AC578_7211 [Pseudocercospora eumusae]
MSTTEEASTYLNHEPTYHNNKDAAYVLPNDAQEHVRLEEQARHLSAIMGNQIIHAPLKPDIKCARMLDVGCGTGIVTDHLGNRFPHAEVYGLDLSTVPQLRTRPSNVTFLQGNIVTDKPSQWLSPGSTSPFQENPDSAIFDLIFSRLLVCGLTNWPGYINKSFQLLKPGAYLEIHDIDWIWYDGTGKAISDSWKWLTACRTVGEAQGMDLAHCASRAKPRMEEAGFTDVVVKEYRWPIGGAWEKDQAWKDFGEYVARYIPPLVWHMIPRLLKGKDGYDDRTIREMQEESVRNFEREEGKHWMFKVTVGRKPS